MKVMHLQDAVAALIFDMDGTLYNSDEYLNDGDTRAILAVGNKMGWPAEQIIQRFNQHRQAIADREKRKATMSETVLSLGLSAQWWNEVRSDQCYRPEQFLKPNTQIVEAVLRLSSRYKLAIASNSPRKLVAKVLETIGFGPILERFEIMAPEDTGYAKPDPRYYAEVAKRLGVAPEQCLSIGDREDADGAPALANGMGAVIVSDYHDLVQICALLRERKAPFKPEALIDSLYRPGEVIIWGVSGQAGAGKTSLSTQCYEFGRLQGIPVWVLGLDTFFKMSSEDRKAWLEEGAQISIEEYNFRADQWNWWDFELLSRSIAVLKAGQPLHLSNVYNRADQGRMTGQVDIVPGPEGMILILEGVAIAHMRQSIDVLTILHAPTRVRLQRLGDRDQHRAGEAILNRFRVTEEFETKYFNQFSHLADMHVDTTGGPHELTSPIPENLSHSFLN